MILVTSDNVLRKYIPNVISYVTGEVSLFEKLSPFLVTAERWVAETFTSDAVLTSIAASAEGNAMKVFATKVVVAHAFMSAVPSLDIVLTANGFGIVSNSNIAPASKERVERLVSSLEAERDRSIKLLLTELSKDTSWLATEQCGFFKATLFPNLDLCDYLGVDRFQWRKFMELRPLIVGIENDIIAEYIGQEQMDAFRQMALRPSTVTSSIVQSVIRSIRAEVLQRVKERESGSSFTPYLLHQQLDLVQVVDCIRKNPSLFPQWHSSSIKELFSDKEYKNEKGSGGYWF